jgi:hypothetical protein
MIVLFQGLNLKIKSVYDLILPLVEVLNLIIFSLSDTLFEVLNTLFQFVEVALDCLKVLIK